MSNWRQTKSRNNNNKYYCNHQRSSKPPLADPKFSVPEWEKEFCAVIGSIPWWRVVEVKRYMHIYESVVKWDDSAGEEAFNNAKSRFWAEKNSLTCDLSLPGPDLYIDDVDWDAEVVDTELYLDLECEPEEPITEEEREPVVIIDPLLLSENTGHIWGTGWGDAEGIKPENSWNDQKCDADGWNKDSWGRKDKSWGDQKCDGWNKDSWGRVENSWGDQKCDGWNKDSWGRVENSWGNQKCDGWNKDPWGRKENSWGDQKGDGWNEDSWGRMENSWDDQKGDVWKKDSWGRKDNSWDDQKGDVWKKDSWGRKDNSWDAQKCDGWNEEDSWVRKNSWGNQKCDGSNKGPWGRQEKTETWAHNNNNNSFNQKKVENWNGRGQGRGNRSWRKTGEVRKGQGDGVEDCRWGNDRGRSRGGFRQHSNKWGRTETF